MFSGRNDSHRHTPEGGRVQVSTDSKDDALVLAVADTGPGVAVELREPLFEPFVTGIPVIQSEIPSISASSTATPRRRRSSPGADYTRIIDQPDSPEIGPASGQALRSSTAARTGC